MNERIRQSANIVYTQHDSIHFGIDTYEIKTVTLELLDEIIKTPGHYTIKINPTVSKKYLHDYGFYYCDTLIEPYCTKEKFIKHQHEAITFNMESNIHDLLRISENAFIYGRFHRDFNIPTQYAENRYACWLKELSDTRNVYTLYYNTDLAGFIAVVENKLVLHALSQKYLGKNLSKYFWSKVCANLYTQGCIELLSSVSAANLSVVNLYASLGFRFRNAVDVYHRLVQ